MKTILIIDCVVALIVLILTIELIESIKATFRKDYPTAKLNKTTLFAKTIAIIAMIVKSLIPIYNIICIIGCLFMRDTMIEKGYETLVNRIITE